MYTCPIVIHRVWSSFRHVRLLKVVKLLLQQVAELHSQHREGEHIGNCINNWLGVSRHLVEM